MFIVLKEEFSNKRSSIRQGECIYSIRVRYREHGKKYENNSMAVTRS